MQTEEYQALRAEIVTHFQILSQHYLTTILATGAILSVAFASKQPSLWLSLAPLIVIVPNAFNYASRSESVQRIGAYIQVFHEQGDGGSGWETRLYRIAPQLGPWGFGAALNRFLYTLVFAGLGLLCVALYLWHPGASWALKSVVAVVAATPLAVAEYRLLVAPSQRQRYLALWQEAREAEGSEAADSGRGDA